MANESKEINPIQNLYSEAAKILEYMILKDQHAADEYETTEIAGYAQMWIDAKLEEDSYISYNRYWTVAMFQEVSKNARIVDIREYMKNPRNVPYIYRDNLLKRGREAFLNQYVEQNDYYRMINGLPPLKASGAGYIYPSLEAQEQLHIPNVPIHMLDTMIQNNYINTDEFKLILEKYKNDPTKEYLKYLGKNKIDLLAARLAKDFEIIRYPFDRSDINPNLLNVFHELYSDYREYVIVTLYNKQLEDLYENYRNFIGFLIIYNTLLQLGNKCLESVISHKYLDDTILHIILSTYGIPDSLLLTNEVRRDLAVNINKLIREKGTDEIYYHLMDILKYQDVIISKFMLMKGKQFDKDNNYKALDESDPYFIKIDLKDKNPYKTITSDDVVKYPYKEIIENDPTWWDLPDVKKILKESAYSVSDSKYIMIESVIHQMEYIMESVYFSRMILDNKKNTDEFKIQIPEIFGTESLSIYDLIVYIIAAACMANGLSGEILNQDFIEGYLYNNKFYLTKINDEYKDPLKPSYVKNYIDIATNNVYRYLQGTYVDITNTINTTRMIATAGFNFDLNLQSFNDYVKNSKHLDKERINQFMQNLTMTRTSDVNRLYNNVIYPMREWLEDKIATTTNRKEFIEYENIYKALYTYDATKNSFYDDYEVPLETIKKKYNISNNDMKAFQHFYPRNITGTPITITRDGLIDDVNGRYHWPFLSKLNPIDWYIHIVIQTPRGDDDRGYVYFHDILNSTDLRTLTNPDGTRIFMDYEDADVGWEINKAAVNKAIELIDQLPEDQLNEAYFQCYTPILNSGGLAYEEGQKLPSIIRSGIYKNILKEKLEMDLSGLSDPPSTYLEYLFRKNKKLYNLLTEGNRINTNREAWMNDLMTIVLAVEAELDIQMKYLEQSVLGEELFFKPLITLIKRFKSHLVEISKTGIKYIFDDKIDAGGNSNMFKLFDDVTFIIQFVTLATNGFYSEFRLYDVEKSCKFNIQNKEKFNLQDEATFFINKQKI